MKILLDASFVYNQVTGLSQYAFHLIRNLGKIDKENKYVVILNTQLSPENELIRVIETFNNFEFLRFNIKPIGPRRDIKFLFIKKKLEPYDVFHSLSSNFPLAMKKNSVVTIHDLTYLRYPKYLGKLSYLKIAYMNFIYNKAAKNASRIITVSDNTRKDFMKHFPVPQTKIQRIYNGFEKLRFRSIDLQKKFGINKKYFLYVGDSRPHKNLIGLIKAFDLIQNVNEDFILILAGNITIDTKDYQSTRTIGRVSFDELQSLYKHSYAVVLPSFYEGFGLTIIEAMSYGKPVITSNLSSMAEIAKDSALLIDPYDIDSIKSAMEKLINSTEKYNFYTSKGIKRYKNFQWSTTATEVLDVYRSVNKQ